MMKVRSQSWSAFSATSPSGWFRKSCGAFSAHATVRTAKSASAQEHLCSRGSKIGKPQGLSISTVIGRNITDATAITLKLMVPLDELKEYPRKTRWRRILTPLIIGAACAVLLVVILQPAEDEDAAPKSMGNFELPLLDGGTLTDEDLSGKPVVVNFFASWCPPCREEAGVLEDGFKKYEGEVQFLGVDVRDTPEDARAFVNEFGVTYPIVKDYDEVLAKRLGVGIGLPQTFFMTEDSRGPGQ